MKWSTFRWILVTLLLGVVGIGMWSAAALKAPSKEGPFVSCEGSPQEAVLAIPSKEVSAWAQVACSKYGHVIFPAEGYVWSFYGGLAPIAFPAQEMIAGRAPEELGHSAYFTRINVAKLKETEATSLATEASWSNEAPDSVPQAWLITATSNKGLVYRFWLLQYPDRIEGALPCPKEMKCDKPGEPMPFFIYDSRNKK